MKRMAVLVLLVLATVLVPGTGSASPRGVHVVDDDRQQCAKAEHRSIQAAVDAAASGDLVRVCAGRYEERVVVDKSISIRGQLDAVEAIDCFGTPPDVDAGEHAVVQAPPGADERSLVRLDADRVELAGLVLQGTPSDDGTDDFEPAAVSTSERHSGYRIHHNLIRENVLGVEFGSSGSVESRVDHNCIRDNTWGLANQRERLTGGLVDHNETTANRVFAYEVGWSVAPLQRSVFAHNTSIGERQAFWVENTHDVLIRSNTIEPSSVGVSGGIQVRGGNTGLQITGNTVRGGTSVGIQLAPPTTVALPRTSGAIVDGNTISNVGAPSVSGVGIGLAANAVTGSVVSGNWVLSNGSTGINVQAGNTANRITSNTAAGNGRYGIWARPGSRDNTFEGNVLRDNGATAAFSGVDVLDDNDPVRNTWTRTACGTSSPAWICAAP